MEPIRDSVILPIEEETQVPAARRAARDLALHLGLSPDAIARAELVAVELAGNILHHAGQGRLFLAPTVSGTQLQVLAIDAGPGISSVDRAMRDGFSTSTTPGFGLGAVNRLSDSSDLYTQLGKGTVVSAIVGEAPESQSTPSTAVLSTPIEGETLNGDSWTIFKCPDRIVFTVIDGLGHGLHACEAAALARNIVANSLAAEPGLALDLLLQRMHGPMRATRGAAIALLSVSDSQATCCGVGNISCVLSSPDGTGRTLVSNNGTLGHQMRRVQEFHAPYAPGTLLIMHSDGISTRWRMSLYPGLAEKSPATIAGALYRDAARGRDDATILVSRLGPEPELAPGGEALA